MEQQEYNIFEDEYVIRRVIRDVFNGKWWDERDYNYAVLFLELVVRGRERGTFIENILSYSQKIRGVKNRGRKSSPAGVSKGIPSRGQVGGQDKAEVVGGRGAQEKGARDIP